MKYFLVIVCLLFGVVACKKDTPYANNTLQPTTPNIDYTDPYFWQYGSVLDSNEYLVDVIVVFTTANPIGLMVATTSQGEIINDWTLTPEHPETIRHFETLRMDTIGINAFGDYNPQVDSVISPMNIKVYLNNKLKVNTTCTECTEFLGGIVLVVK